MSGAIESPLSRLACGLLTVYFFTAQQHTLFMRGWNCSLTVGGSSDSAFRLRHHGRAMAVFRHWHIHCINLSKLIIMIPIWKWWRGISFRALFMERGVRRTRVTWDVRMCPLWSLPWTYCELLPAAFPVDSHAHGNLWSVDLSRPRFI